MANIVITNNDTGSVAFGDGGEFRDELLTFAAAATLKAGTILARDSVSLKLVPFAKGGVTNGNGVPKAVLTYAVTAAGAGDVAVRAMVRGEVNADRLVINADGDNSNVDAAVLDGLRAYGITAIDVAQLSSLDNQ